MITLYRHSESALGAEIQDALEEMVIQHEVVIVNSEDDFPEADGVSLQKLPALVDDGTIYTGEEALHQRLDVLRELMGNWNRFQSDACYLDEEGRVCGNEAVRNEDGPGMSSNPALHSE